ncbi:uncharacterized protein LAESUDRAFT_71068 [Laetiporus sulphureus 93-53]|uniref:Uncharacterized protein n=1 Tax=Laetiporus sulphureus 93-53 TaxID=1314785 RepID=A0A165AX00_9APHY|nr:uncharacterized protein LAESUDRAFT_71068 [Laetiporus sulphureus 93-53]KZS99813.1 hypothetical protein LAESUDRAFT_71068 [Laetiporus sulphureus 93-53]
MTRVRVSPRVRQLRRRLQHDRRGRRRSYASRHTVFAPCPSCSRTPASDATIDASHTLNQPESDISRQCTVAASTLKTHSVIASRTHASLHPHPPTIDTNALTIVYRAPGLAQTKTLSLRPCPCTSFPKQRSAAGATSTEDPPRRSLPLFTRPPNAHVSQDQTHRADTRQQTSEPDLGLGHSGIRRSSRRLAPRTSHM